MNTVNSSPCISAVRATTLALMGLPVPADIAAPNKAVLDLAKQKLGENPVDRVVLYNPDAVALWIYQKYISMFESAAGCSDLALPMYSVMPSVTPVCFASMYTGVMPAVHGIQKYEKPVLTVDTLFDDMVKAGKKAAIVSTAGDSISKIFLERKIDYFIYNSVGAVNRKAKKLIEQDKYDLIIIYNGNYDSNMHKVGPEGKKAIKALTENIAVYTDYVNFIREQWPQHNVFYGFCPDHGCHLIDGNSGSHGLDMDEDMNIIHFYGIKTATK